MNENLTAALVKAQSEFPAIPRNKEVTVTGSRGSYKFSYAPFEDILRHVKPILAKHGLGFMQGASGEKLDRLTTRILHSSGEYMDSDVAVVNPTGTAQSYGSALTYSRRYGFCAAFGIQADDDDDANAADGNTVTQSAERPHGKIAASDIKRESWEKMPADEQKFLREISLTVIALLDEGRADDAYGLIEAKRLEIEEKYALWYLFDRSHEKALREATERAALQRNAAERNKHQQSRPTARSQ